MFLLEENKPTTERSPKIPLVPSYRLFAKPLSPKRSDAQSSQGSFALYAFNDGARVVLEFIENVLGVVFLERDRDQSQAFWDREHVPCLDERLRVFLGGPSLADPGDEQLVALAPRSKNVPLEIDHETKSSTMAALGRLDEEAELPVNQTPALLAPTSEFESDEYTDDDAEYIDTVEGPELSFPGYTLRVARDHPGQRGIFGALVRDPMSNANKSLLVFHNHFTALGPESCLQLSSSSMISSSPLTLTAGCSHSSQISEALSAELLLQYDLALHKTEMELIYLRPSPKIDFTCTHTSSSKHTLVGDRKSTRLNSSH